MHGRFQVFHLEHLEYVQAALEQVDFLHIGITGVKGFPVSLGSGRLDQHANPLTYAERARMIRRVLAGEGISSDRYATTPFPIEHPELLSSFIGTEVSCFTTVREPWNLEKIALLKEIGYDVIVLRNDFSKKISGTGIRELLAEGNPAWRDMVPNETAALLDKWNVRERLLGE